MDDLIVPVKLWPLFRQRAYDQSISIAYEITEGGMRILTKLDVAREILTKIEEYAMKKMTEIEFQRECGELVSKEVHCCVSMEINYILKKSWEDSDALYSWEDVENLYIYKVELSDGWVTLSEGEKEDLLNEKKDDLMWFESDIEEISDEIDDMENEFDDLDMIEVRTPEEEGVWGRLRKKIDLKEEELRDLEDQLCDIESDIETLEDAESEQQEIYEWWMVDSMLASNLSDMGHPILDGNIWGRCTTGQAIKMDYAIREIVKKVHGGIEIVEEEQ